MNWLKNISPKKEVLKAYDKKANKLWEGFEKRFPEFELFNVRYGDRLHELAEFYSNSLNSMN